jgi:hypothetical protein
MIPECPVHHQPLKRLIVKAGVTIWGCSIPDCTFRYRQVMLEGARKGKEAPESSKSGLKRENIGKDT